MLKSRFSPREIVQRLQVIETLTAEGTAVSEALRSVGMRQAEYDRWCAEYSGLERTLGPLLSATPRLVKKGSTVRGRFGSRLRNALREASGNRSCSRLSTGGASCDGRRVAASRHCGCAARLSQRQRGVFE